jgi:hypothetical protein
MGNFSDSFMEYLKIYNPSAYDKANSDNVKPEELAAIYNENAAKFEVWDSIPLTIRNRYPGQPVPYDVMEAAARGEIYTLREMEYHPEIRQVSEAREKVAEEQGMPNDIVSDTAAATFVTALAAGYAAETCYHLAMSRQNREEMLKNKHDGMTDEEHAAWLKSWLATREKDFNAIKNDWKENQPEKYLMHLLFKHNIGKLNQKELEEFPQTVQDLMQRIEAVPDRMSNLLEYIKKPRMQARIGRFNEETMDILKHTVLRQVPETEKEQYLARDFAKRREELRNMPDSDKARMVSDSINSRVTNLPEERTLTTRERFANMPSALNQGMER